MEKTKAVAELKGCLKTLNELTAYRSDDPGFVKWRRDTRIALQHIFPNGGQCSEFVNLSFTSWFIPHSGGSAVYSSAFTDGRKNAVALLESMIDEVQKYGLDNIPERRSSALSNRVFVVHGHDNEAKESVARLISQLGLEPIILHEQPNMGKTVIEKFVDHAEVGFAVVILTGDDRGGLKSKPVESYKDRARQNVILELGFFLGKLGREQVCALYQDGVEIPSDYKGVLFVPLDDSGAWRYSVAKEMRAVGLDVDLNKIK